MITHSVPKTMLPERRGLTWKRLFLFVAMASCLLWRSAAMAQLHATLEATPVEYTGNCPGVITFTGTIKSDKPTHVTYIFTRSDGATDTQPKTLEFKKPGSQTVSTTWTLGNSALPDYSGWEAIKIIQPKTITSNHADFKLQCADSAPPHYTYNLCKYDPTACAATCPEGGCGPIEFKLYCDDCPVFQPGDPLGDPEYRFAFTELTNPEILKVELLDPAGNLVPAKEIRTGGTIALSFRPSREFAGRVREYKVRFNGARGNSPFDIKSRLEISRQNGQ